MIPMLTKAIIIDKVGNDNHYIVRIPILESAGDTNIATREAILAYNGGVIEALKPDDVVIVGFENHSADNPIIVGKLFLMKDASESRGYANIDSLKVSKSASLPNDLTIGGQEFKNFPNMLNSFITDTQLSEVVSNSKRYLHQVHIKSSGNKVATIVYVNKSSEKLDNITAIVDEFGLLKQHCDLYVVIYEEGYFVDSGLRIEYLAMQSRLVISTINWEFDITATTTFEDEVREY